MIRLLNRHALRRLRPADRPLVLDYLRREPEVNLFILGDIENYGFEHADVEHWGELDARGRLLGLLTRYYASVIFYSREEYDVLRFARQIRRFNYRMLSGERSILEPFAQSIEFTQRRDTYLCRLECEAMAAGVPPDGNGVLMGRVREGRLDDTPRILALLETIEEFGPADPEELQRRLTLGNGRVFYLEDAGGIVAVAQTSAETGQAAMVIGVATHPGWRRQGYATACLRRLCTELRAEGRGLCLFYNNPEAGRIYHRLGFVDIGQWTMLIR